MKNIKLALLFLTLTFSGTLMAMVDYSNFSRTGEKKPPVVKGKKNLERGRMIHRARPRHYRIRGDFSMGMENIRSNGSQNFWIMESSLQTPWDFFTKARYRHGEVGDGKRGNLRLLLGFNWLGFGSAGSRVSVDVFGGVVPGVTDSDFATSRTDTFLGLKTRKEFYQLAVEMGLQHHVTGTPEGGEMAVGDIQTAFGELSWQVSQDIFLALGGGAVKVSPQEEGLKSELSWGYLNPQLRLNLSRWVALSFDAHLRTSSKKSFQEVAARARLWDFPGACGDSLKASLSLTL